MENTTTERINGLILIKGREDFIKNTIILINDLEEEGFDREDINEYLCNIIKSTAKIKEKKY